MSVQQHPEYDKESKHLEFVKRYISAVIKTGETNEDKFKENIREAFVDLDWFDSSLSYINILTNAKFLATSAQELENLRKIQSKPYFAKIQLQRNDSEEKEEYYLGKTSLYQRESQDPIIVDWRSPIANVYYDGRIGDVSYEFNGHTYDAYLSLKRQFVIENGELEAIRDVDLTTTDELLQESLEGSAGTRLTEIVSTIQQEQNRVIRFDLNRPIIVQGAAGSGKTTIALHRISYFIYQYADQFDPSKLMILAPNHVFLDYISEALPELGVEKIKQTTFTDFAQQVLDKELKLIYNKDIETLMNNSTDQTDELKYISTLKGATFFRNIINNYVDDILPTFFPEEDFKVDKFKLFGKKKIKNMFLTKYDYLPLYRRADKIKNIIKHDFSKKKKKMIEKVETFYDEKLDTALYSIREPEKRKEMASKLITKKEIRLKEVNQAIKGATQRYFKQFPNKNLFTYYKELWKDPEQLVKYSDNQLSLQAAEKICNHSKKLTSKNKYELEDLALLMLLKEKLYGIDPDLKMKKIIIDEAQDYSPMQFIALRDTMETNLFTIVGDLAQGIYDFQGLKSWEILEKEILNNATYTELQKSYRNTIEIMDVANHIVDQLDIDVPKVEPVVRHGEQPTFNEISQSEGLVPFIKDELQTLKEKKLSSFAIIGKTHKDCEQLNNTLKDTFNIQYIDDPNERIEEGKITILPSYLSKGLEFDSVFVVSLDETFSSDQTDIKLLYVSCTRPLHRLKLFGRHKRDLLLETYQGWDY